MDAANTADRAVQCNRNTRKLKFVQWLAQTSFNFSAQPPILPSTPSQNILSGGHRSHQDTFCTFVVLDVRDDIRLSDVTKDAPVHQIESSIRWNDSEFDTEPAKSAYYLPTNHAA